MELILYFLLSFFIGLIGEDRKFGFWGYFAASIILTPLGGFLLLIPSESSPKSDF
jgi:hypothetical protein